MDHAASDPAALQPPRRSSVAASAVGWPIGDAARRSGVSAKMIRYYESIGLVRPAARSAANYRSYDAAAIRTLRFVARARSLGFSMPAIARLLALWQEAAARSSAEVKAVALAHVADLDRRIADMQEMRTMLETLARQCCGDAAPECPIIDELAGDQRPARFAPRRRSDA